MAIARVMDGVVAGKGAEAGALGGQSGSFYVASRRGFEACPIAVLHASPEGAAGGVLALVENGDETELDVARRRLELLVSKKELVKCKYVQGPASHMHFSTDGRVRAVSTV